MQRTQRALREALTCLLIERGWDDLSVRDLCERADVGRSTFYARFGNKEELLDISLADLRLALVERARGAAAGEAQPLSFVRGLIDHVADQRTLFRALIGRRSGQVVQSRFRQIVLRLVQDDLAQHVAKSWQREAAARYLAGALFELLAWWADAKVPVPAEEIDALISKLALSVLRQLRMREA